MASFFIPLLAYTISPIQNTLKLAIVAGITTLTIGANYSYNSLKDAKEDVDNPFHPTPFKKSGANSIVKAIPYTFFVTALLLSFIMTNVYSFLLLLLFILCALAYSYFKIKRFLFVKTITVSLCYTILLVSCYLAFSSNIVHEVVYSGILLFILMFSYSVVSDMRDIESDRKHRLITIPVKYGYSKAMMLVAAMFFILNLSALIFYLSRMIAFKETIIFLIFMPIEILIIKNLHASNLSGIDILKDSSFTLTAFFMLIFF